MLPLNISDQQFLNQEILLPVISEHEINTFKSVQLQQVPNNSSIQYIIV